MLGKLFVALTIAASTVVALPSTFTRRTDDLATCHYVFVPGVPVDPATTNLVAEFNYITGRSLAVAVTPNVIRVCITPVFNVGPGSTFVENADGSFDVDNGLSADGWTCAQTAAFMESLAGSNQLGPSGVTWLIQSSECTCGN
ncbi:hypothetical protein D9756_006249 [Leucocoprinus leucothites]|uniref:Uncharacterized protein n=1 Tax=Leucocoprinus leucothites TaxID=201217 RepID=A0A8H5FXW1_9AGAR|nr:hypothetical protein D9756_006249 [Leucoagaricus leucothites]